MAQGVIRLLHPIPDAGRRTLTWDQDRADLSISTQADLDAISRRSNHLTRRSLNWGHAHRHYYGAFVATTG